MTKFTRCDACGNDEVGDYIYRCSECNTLYCNKCEGMGAPLSNMVFTHGWCPNCDVDGEEYVRNDLIGEIEAEDEEEEN